MAISQLDADQVIRASRPETLVSGAKAVTTTGAITATSTELNSGVWLKASAANTQIIYVGTSGVSNANGYPLDAGESVFLAIDNLADIHAVSHDDSSQSLRYVGS